MAERGTYYRRRVEEELAAAERASDPAVASIHRELARRYREIVETRVRLAPVNINEGALIAWFNGT